MLPFHARPEEPSSLANLAVCIDHIAIAVTDLEESLSWFTSVLGFSLKERRTTEGATSGMLSAVVEAGPLQLVLLQGTGSTSQVSRYIDKYGPGVHHLAIRVQDAGALVDEMARSGLEFDTSLIEGGGLRQIFSKRRSDSGVMFEFIERTESGFADQNVTNLFKQLEQSDSF
jgi:methylmalonyl-CoA/ethylmalonyl-CoA epimerase